METLETIKNKVSENLIQRKHYITITTSHKYGIEKTSSLRVYFNASNQKQFTITNTDSCTFKNYENETSFYNAVKRLLKKQTNKNK
tara:strand:+ start:419 stop:676 length:258 start_codon:yes stop_codon:yes gene_type:complete